MGYNMSNELKELIDAEINKELDSVNELIEQMKAMHETNKSVVSAMEFLSDCIDNKKRL